MNREVFVLSTFLFQRPGHKERRGKQGKELFSGGKRPPWKLQTFAEIRNLLSSAGFSIRPIMLQPQEPESRHLVLFASEMRLAFVLLSLVAVAAPQVYPVTGQRIDPTFMPTFATNEMKLHNWALNKNQYSILLPDGRMSAVQFFMKKTELPVSVVDVERFLEVLTYIHEYLEWGPNGPPNGFSIANSANPNNNLPYSNTRRKREVKAEPWQQKVKRLVDRLNGKETEEQFVDKLIDLYMREIRPFGTPLERVVREVDAHAVKKGMEKASEGGQGELVTIFDTEAEKKYKGIVERHAREAAKEGRKKKKKKSTEPYVKAVGNYILVPKNMNNEQLQEAFRQTLKEQRHKRDRVNKLKLAAQRARSL